MLATAQVSRPDERWSPGRRSSKRAAEASDPCGCVQAWFAGQVSLSRVTIPLQQ